MCAHTEQPMDRAEYVYSCCPNMCNTVHCLNFPNAFERLTHWSTNTTLILNIYQVQTRLYIVLVKYSFIKHIDIAHTVTSDNWRTTRLWIKPTCGAAAAGIMTIRSKYCKIAAHSRRFSMLLLTGMTFCILFKFLTTYL